MEYIPTYIHVLIFNIVIGLAIIAFNMLTDGTLESNKIDEIITDFVIRFMVVLGLSVLYVIGTVVLLAVWYYSILEAIKEKENNIR